jgi:hypothetical protein
MLHCNPFSALSLHFWLHETSDSSPGAPLGSQAARVQGNVMAESQSRSGDVADRSSSRLPSREARPPGSAQVSRVDGIASGSDDLNANIEGHDHWNDQQGATNDTPSFTTALHEYQNKLDQDFVKFEASLDAGEIEDLEADDEYWEQLEDNYQRDVGTMMQKEQDIIARFDARFKVSNIIAFQRWRTYDLAIPDLDGRFQ